MKKIILLSLSLVFLIAGCSALNLSKTTPSASEEVVVLAPDQAKQKAADFINKNLMQPGSTATLGDVTEESGLYKIVVNIPGGQIPQVNSYMTKDGKIFFTQGLDIEEYEAQAQAAKNSNPNSQAQTPAAEPPKSDKPVVDVFVMSHCPFGTQIEKGILPVMNLLDDDEAEIDVKFVHYAMHGDKEVIEEEKQYCIQKNEEDKYDDYLKCFLASSGGTAQESDACVDQVGIDKTKLQKCIDSTDVGDSQNVKLNADESKKYGVQGSPTLVINGKQISTSRDPQSLLNTICSAFNVKPEDCNVKLSTQNPSSGFGEGAGAPSGGGCGS